MTVMTIDRTTVFQKTAKGRAEIGQRLAGLSAVNRQLLIVIDGVKDAGTLATMFPRSDVLEALGCLAQEGFIDAAVASAPVPVADPAFGAFRKAIEAPLAAPAPLPEPVQAVDTGVLAEAKRFMIASAKGNIGLLAERLIARIDGAQTLADLSVVASQWHMALRDSKRGKPVADALLEHVLGLLGEPAHPVDGAVAQSRG